MSNIDFLASEISNRFGTVKRAKQCFLYTAKGVRLVDMYQEGGRAILGWGGNSAFTMFKNVLCRGISGSFNTDFPYRTKKAVSELLFSDREISIFYSKEAAIKAAVFISATGTCVYKPWNPVETKWCDVDVVVFAPTLPWCQNIYIVAAKSGLIGETGMPDGEKLPAPLHAAIARSIYDLIAALQERQEKDWFLYDQILAKYWERKGPYLYPKMPAENYRDFIVHCLDCGLAISPEYNTPSIIPYGADKGVFTKLKNNPFEYKTEN